MTQEILLKLLKAVPVFDKSLDMGEVKSKFLVILPEESMTELYKDLGDKNTYANFTVGEVLIKNYPMILENTLMEVSVQPGDHIYIKQLT